MRSLTEQQWDVYFEWVERLEKLPPDGRQAQLPALRAEIANRDIVSLVELHLGLTPELDRCRSGERIRNLVLAERIGCGGMGTVYRATQGFAGGIEREVAVKLINPALILHEPDHSQQRFRQEIGALVRLEHKGIARIYDGGLYRCPARGDESLYFAMELVRGKPLTEYVAEQQAQLGTSGILRLFLRVCDAVAYAHRQGVVHRDLKPANILVDSGGEPRVIDFGLAEAFGASVAGDRAGLICGTPAYMSPEQLGGAASAPTVDVHALGVILHELLTGRRPQQACNAARPARADALGALRAACGSELAAIVGKATAERAGERYPSVAAFADALVRWLDATEARRQTLLRTRRFLVGRVRQFWIDGVLARSLHAAARIELGLALEPDAVEHPWDLIVQSAGAPARAVARGTPIDELFERCGRALLILGAPGAGKTTLLLELAAALLARAEQSETQRVPLVLHLSTWAEQRLPLADWIVDELDKRYDVPPAAACACLAREQLILLLDGLDEVAPPHRAACVTALNALRRDRGATPLAVCSRLADYEALSMRLRLESAVMIQPLTRECVDAYLERAGAPLAGVRATLIDDAALRELLTTPLLLSIAALAYAGEPPAACDDRAIARQHVGAPPAAGEALSSAAQPAHALDDRRAALLATYAQAMFTRRRLPLGYDQARSMRWLAWLARAMREHHQSVFYLEWMQPSWLAAPIERWTVGAGSIVLCGLLVGIVVGLGSGLAGELAWRLPLALLLGLAGGALFGLLGWGDEIRPIAGLRWSWRSLREALPAKLTLAAGVGLLLGCGVALLFDHAVGAALGLMAALGFFYFGGLDRDLARSDAAGITTPNQGIRQSLRNALRGAAAGALIGALAGGVIGGVPALLFCATVFSLVLSMIAGAHPCLQHLLLRWLLWRSGCAPWRYVHFLDFAAERILLHRIGGGYAFAHRALLEYFAGLPSAEPDGQQRDGETTRPASTNRHPARDGDATR